MANSSAVIPDNLIVVDGDIGSVPSPESGDAGKILVVNSDLEPEWSTPSGGTQYSAGTGIEISDNNAISIDSTVVATQSDLSDYQPVISDLSDIRSGAAAGATAVQPSSLATVATTGAYSDLTGTPDLSGYVESSDLATVATTGAYSDLTGTPTIPVVDQTYDASSANAQSGVAVAGALANVNQVPSATSSDENKVLTVDSNGDPTWSTPSGGTQYSAGTGIDISAQNAISIDTTVVATQTDLSGIDQVPTVTSNDDGKVLKATYSGGVGSFDWATLSGGNDNVFIADSTTTQGDLFAAYQAKKSLFVYYSNRIYPITNNAAGGASMLILNGCYVKTSGQSVEATMAEIRIALTNGSPTSPTTAVNIATYSAISVSNQTLASLNTAGITDIQQVNALPAQPISTVLYLIPET